MATNVNSILADLRTRTARVNSVAKSGQNARVSRYRKKITDSLGNSKALSARLIASRKAREDKLQKDNTEFFNRTAGVLNKQHLDALVKASLTSGTPTFTSFIAGYELSRASRADREQKRLDTEERRLKRDNASDAITLASDERRAAAERTAEGRVFTAEETAARAQETRDATALRTGATAEIQAVRDAESRTFRSTEAEKARVAAEERQKRTIAAQDRRARESRAARRARGGNASKSQQSLLSRLQGLNGTPAAQIPEPATSRTDPVTSRTEHVTVRPGLLDTLNAYANAPNVRRAGVNATEFVDAGVRAARLIKPSAGGLGAFNVSEADVVSAGYTLEEVTADPGIADEVGVQKLVSGLDASATAAGVPALADQIKLGQEGARQVLDAKPKVLGNAIKSLIGDQVPDAEIQREFTNGIDINPIPAAEGQIPDVTKIETLDTLEKAILDSPVDSTSVAVVDPLTTIESLRAPKEVLSKEEFLASLEGIDLAGAGVTDSVDLDKIYNEYAGVV